MNKRMLDVISVIVTAYPQYLNTFDVLTEALSQAKHGELLSMYELGEKYTPQIQDMGTVFYLLRQFGGLKIQYRVNNNGEYLYYDNWFNIPAYMRRGTNYKIIMVYRVIV